MQDRINRNTFDEVRLTCLRLYRDNKHLFLLSAVSAVLIECLEKEKARCLEPVYRVIFPPSIVKSYFDARVHKIKTSMAEITFQYTVRKSVMKWYIGYIHRLQYNPKMSSQGHESRLWRKQQLRLVQSFEKKSRALSLNLDRAFDRAFQVLKSWWQLQRKYFPFRVLPVNALLYREDN